MIPIDRIGFSIQLAGMILKDYGSDSAYAVYLPDEEVLIPFAFSMSEDEWKNLLRQADLQEIEILANDDGNLKKAVIRKSTRQIESRVSWNVYRRDGYKCRYCGNDKTPLTVDHLILWEKGGPSTEDNLVACCKRCNKTRGNTEYVEWLRSDRYRKVAKNLSDTEEENNWAVTHKLKNIEVFPHTIEKRKKRRRH